MKSIRFCLFILIATTFFSCEGDYTITYRWNGMHIQNADNGNKYPEPSNADSISASVYCIQLDMDTEELSRKGRYLDPENPPINVNPVDSIWVRSDLEFSSDFPAGSNLYDNFNNMTGSYFSSEITNIYNANFEEDPNVRTIYLLLKNLPETLGGRKFIVDFYLKDGTIFSDSLTVKLY